MNMLAAMSWGQWGLGFVLVCTCLLLVLVILLQRGRGGGLAGAFGGAGGSSAFGAKTGDVFTWITVVVATVFVLLSVVTNFVYDESGARSATAAPLAPIEVPLEAPDGAPITIPVTGEPSAVEPPAITTTEGQPVKITPIDAPPPEILKMMEEQMKQQQAKDGASAPKPGADGNAPVPQPTPPAALPEPKPEEPKTP